MHNYLIVKDIIMVVSKHSEELVKIALAEARLTNLDLKHTPTMML